MAGPDRLDVMRFMARFRAGEAELSRALTLFAEREDLGFIWLAHREDALVGCVSVGYAIGTVAGGIVAVVRDLYVDPAARRIGIAGTLLDTLAARLAGMEIAAIEVMAGTDEGLQQFLAARGLTGLGLVCSPRR